MKVRRGFLWGDSEFESIFPVMGGSRRCENWEEGQSFVARFADDHVLSSDTSPHNAKGVLSSSFYADHLVSPEER